MTQIRTFIAGLPLPESRHSFMVLKNRTSDVDRHWRVIVNLLPPAYMLVDLRVDQDPKQGPG